jgi:hypothetical protein
MEATAANRLSNRQLAAGFFRAWAVVWAVYAALGLFRLANVLIRNPYSPSQPGAGYYAGAEAVWFACQVLVVVFLMRKADWLAKVVFPVEAELGLGLSGADLRAVLYSAVGLYFLVAGGSRAVGHLYLWTRDLRTVGRPISSAFSPDGLVSSLAEAALGAIVLFGRRGSRGPFSSVREAYDNTLGLHEPRDPGGAPAPRG